MSQKVPVNWTSVQVQKWQPQTPWSLHRVLVCWNKETGEKGIYIHSSAILTVFIKWPLNYALTLYFWHTKNCQRLHWLYQRHRARSLHADCRSILLPFYYTYIMLSILQQVAAFSLISLVWFTFPFQTIFIVNFLHTSHSTLWLSTSGISQKIELHELNSPQDQYTLPP